jgi:signal transduction histidine kinase/CheY-like chemotaxis protein
MPGILPQFLRELGYVLFKHQGQRMFAPLSPAPAWLMELWEIPPGDQAEIPLAEKSPFLENFLQDADTFWASNSGGLCQSETWIEKSPSGKEIPIQAVALWLDGKRYLALQSPEPQFRERAQLLQTARNSLLSHEKLQREIQKKEILLHCIIHDLSQPLSVMSVALDSLADERVSTRGKGLLELGRKASEQQSSMIRDVLQVFSADLKASLEAEGKAGPAPDLLQCARVVQTAFAPVYAAKNVRLVLNEPTEERANWRVRGEESRLQRIFSNLLENALRYAPDGSRVTIGVASEGEFVKAFVDDEGPGLPADLSSAQIFALFSKGKEGGGKAGLGLYFCRLTVERWGGAIGCGSLPGRGSRFWFHLPRRAPQGAVGAKTTETQALSQGEKPLAAKRFPMRILLADDQKEIRLLTKDQLERRGHHVVAVGNGQEVLDAIQREAFDVILMDEEMPVMTGLQALQAIRQREKELGRMVVIALTGYNTEPDRARLLHAGFDSVIGKPFRLGALDALLKESAGNTQFEPKREPDALPAQTPVAILLQRVDGDEKLARKIISTFLKDTPPRMAGLQKAMQKNDGGSLASLAHALKGSVSIFGAEGARERSQKLQEMGHAKDFGNLARVYEQLKEEIAELEVNLRGYAGQRSPVSTGASPKRNRRGSSPKRKTP